MMVELTGSTAAIPLDSRRKSLSVVKGLILCRVIFLTLFLTITAVAGGGGCFLNAILSRELNAALKQQGLVLVEASQVPPNDGGLSLGQARVALYQLEH